MIWILLAVLALLVAVVVVRRRSPRGTGRNGAWNMPRRDSAARSQHDQNSWHDFGSHGF